MYEQYPLLVAIDKIIIENRRVLEVNWSKFGQFATISAPSAAWTLGTNWTHDGPVGTDPSKIKCASHSKFAWNEHGEKYFKLWEQLAHKSGISLYDILRGGACYYAGPYQNKQLQQWIRNREILAADATAIYRTPMYQNKVRPMMLDIIHEEHQRALEVFERCYGDPDLCVGNKSPDTGTGLRAPFNTRGRMREAFRERNPNLSMVRDDIILSEEGQKRMYTDWPFRGTFVSGFKVYIGLRGGSRDDSDVERVEWLSDREMQWYWTSVVRRVNTLCVSWTGNNLTTPSSYQRDQLARYKPPSYMHPMDPDFLATFLPVPPATANFIREDDTCAMDLDWGYAYPAPYAEFEGDKLKVVIPKEEYKSGADQLIGIGNASIGIDGFYTPELSSGRPSTRRQYQATVDNVVQLSLDEVHITFKGGSNGDDQILIVKAKDVPGILKKIGKHARMKGSKGNWTFRCGRQLFFESPDLMHVGIVPRPTKTSTTAQALQTLGPDVKQTLKVGESANYSITERAAEAVAATWKLAPEVFYMRGAPHEIAAKYRSPRLRAQILEAVELGLLAPHHAAMVGGYIDADLYT